MKPLDLSPYIILLVDDVTFSRETVLKLLKGMGDPEVRHAESGDHALKVLESEGHVDFVLSDFKMPGFNGLQLLKAIRTGQTSARRETPFAMLTGYSDRHLVDMALALDVNAFLTKPISKKALAARLNKMLNRDETETQIKPSEIYEGIAIEEAEEESVPEPAPPAGHKMILKNVAITREVVGGMSSLKGKFQQSDLTRNITNGVDRLVTATGGEAAARVVSFIDDLVDREILELEDIPDILDARDVGPWSPNAPDKRNIISGVWVSADSGKGDEMFYALDEIPLGAVLAEDIQAKDGSQFIKKGIPLTQQVISILAHLRKVGALALSSMEIEGPGGKPEPGSEPPGVFAAFSSTPENDGRTMAFDSEGPPTERLSHAMRGAAGWEKSVPASEIPDGATLTRDIYTADGRLYMYAGSELTGKVISILRDLQELENLKTDIWISTK